MEAYTLPPAAVIPVKIADRDPVNFDVYGTVEVIRKLQDGATDHQNFLAELGSHIANVFGVAAEQIAINQVEAFHRLVVEAYNAIYEHTKKNDGSIACLQQLIPGYQASSSGGAT